MSARIRATALAAVLLSMPVSAGADVVLDWNAVLIETFAAQSPAVNPFAQARFAAITHLAVLEAVQTSDAAGASPEAAAAGAAHAVLRTYFPGSGAALDAHLAASLASIADGPAKDEGRSIGEAAAAGIVAARAADGSTPPQFHLPSSLEPGEWQTTPSCPPAGGILRHWGQVAPFAIERGDRFRSAPPPNLASGLYARDYEEVKAVGDAGSTLRPPDRADVARFYAVVLAVPVWNPAARQVAFAQGRSLFENARDFALLNMAISDALVSVMETKYHYNFWRPETAIAVGDNDGNGKTIGDPTFAPFIPAPCFPSYPSAHASASYAARAILERVYGPGPHAVMLMSPAVPGVVLHYTSFKEITRDIDDARVYGGIHFRFEQVAGARQGWRVGRHLLKLLPRKPAGRTLP